MKIYKNNFAWIKCGTNRKNIKTRLCGEFTKKKFSKISAWCGVLALLAHPTRFTNNKGKN